VILALGRDWKRADLRQRIGLTPKRVEVALAVLRRAGLVTTRGEAPFSVWKAFHEGMHQYMIGTDAPPEAFPDWAAEAKAAKAARAKAKVGGRRR